MVIDNLDILIYVSIFFVIIVGTLLAMVLWRAFTILSYAERVMGYVDHVRGLLAHWETLPLRALDRILDVAFSGGKKRK